MSDHDQYDEARVPVSSEAAELSSDDGQYSYERGKACLRVLYEETGVTEFNSDPAVVALFDLGMAFARRQSELEEVIRVMGRAAHVARSLLKEALRNEIRLMAPNEYARKIHSVAQKIGASYGEVEPLLTSIITELVDEMTRLQHPKVNARRKRR